MNTLHRDILNEAIDIPPGLAPIPDLNPERMRQIVKNFCRLIITEIAQDVENGKRVILNFPLKGGYLIYWEIKKFLKQESCVNLLPFIDFHFATKSGRKNANGKSEYISTVNISNINAEEIDRTVIYNIDLAIREIFEQFSDIRSRYTSSKNGKNYYETLHPNEQYYRYEDMWVTAGFGMNSSLVNEFITNLERASGASWYVIDPSARIIESWSEEDLKNYQNLLMQNPYFEDPDEQAAFIHDLEILSSAEGEEKLRKALELHNRTQES